MKTCPSCNNLNPADVLSCIRCGSPLAPHSRPAPAANTTAAVEFKVGGSLGGGRYVLEQLLGEGAMGKVFRAQDTRLGRVVALKVLSAARVGDSQAWRRMTREGEAMAKIEHPNVVRVLDVFEEGLFLVLVQEYVAGGDLRTRMSGPMAASEALRLMDGILDGLSAIHDADYVHRDMKPGNILLTPEGTPKITDLGIVHDRQGRSMTRAGTQLGTPHYMAPEQIKAKPDLDARVDIYACGVILYELLAGRVPFDGESDYEVFDGHIKQPPDLSHLGDVPQNLRQAIEGALAKNLDERWLSTLVMKRALRDPEMLGAARRSQEAGPTEPKTASARPSRPSEPGRSERPDWMSFGSPGAYLRAMREWRQLSLEELAEQLGYVKLRIGANRISEWELNGSVPIARVDALARALEIDKPLLLELAKSYRELMANAEELAQKKARPAKRMDTKAPEAKTPKPEAAEFQGGDLRSLRKQRNLTREQLADSLGYVDLKVGVQKIAAWEQGTPVSPGRIQALAKSLQVSKEQLKEAIKTTVASRYSFEIEGPRLNRKRHKGRPGEFIRERRKWNGLSEFELALQVKGGTTEADILEWEINGKVPADRRRRLAAVLGILSPEFDVIFASASDAEVDWELMEFWGEAAREKKTQTWIACGIVGFFFLFILAMLTESITAFVVMIAVIFVFLAVSLVLAALGTDVPWWGSP